jgi:uncharacterized membrane protein
LTIEQASGASSKPRRGYLDWARGVAVLIMIQAHLFDSWTRADARNTWPFAWAMIVAGFGAPLFLFLAGTSVALSAGSKWRRGGDISAAATAVMKRGGWLFLLAFVFRIQAWVLGWGAPRSLLKVDILNIMGPSIVAAAFVWGAFRTVRARVIASGAVLLAITFLTPAVRWTPVLDRLPNPIEAYVRPIPGLSNFYFFPWAGFVFAGMLVGVLLDNAGVPEAESRVNARLFAAGSALTIASGAASFFPTPYTHSDFWTTSPAFFLLRTGILVVLIPAAYVWQKLVTRASWSPIQQLGRTSLFIYWIHVEMIYGLISLRIHKSLTHPQAWAAYVAFAAFMLLCSIAKERWARARKEQGRTKEGKGRGPNDSHRETTASSSGVSEASRSARPPAPASRGSASTTACE